MNLKTQQDNPESLKILIVEDCQHDYRFTVKIMADIPHYQFDIDWSRCADDAITAVESTNYDVCLLDYRIGADNGLEVLSRIAGGNADIPVIFITGMSNHDIDLRAMNAGAADFLVKGKFDADLLERSIRYTLRHCRAIREVRESRERYELAFAGARDGLWDWDLKTGRIHYSGRWKAMLGYNETEIGDEPGEWFDRIHPAEIHRVQAEVEAHCKGASPTLEFECRMRNKSGCFRWMANRGVAIRDAEGTAYRLAGSLTDISNQKHVETVLGDFNRRMSEKNRELESVIHTTSHDLRNPLVNIQGFSKELTYACRRIFELHQDETLTDDTQKELNTIVTTDIPEAVNFINSSVKRMDALLNGLLELSRIGRATIKVETVDMNRMLARIKRSMETQIQSCNADVKLQSLPPCSADAALIERVFANILDNALRFLDLDRPGFITVAGAARDDSNQVTYSIIDNGIGIAAHQRDRIFEIFHRAGDEGGEGLGLSISRKLINMHGGSIRVESSEGEGSTFFISLPAPAPGEDDVTTRSNTDFVPAEMALMSQ